MRRLGLWLRALFRPEAVEAELAQEIRHHIEMETDKNLRAGMSPAEARRKAMVDFGGVERFKEETRRSRVSWPLEEVARDVVYALRRFRRASGMTLAVVLCMGLGLGVTAATLSFFFGIVLRPLPFPEAHRLAVLYETAPGFTRASPSLADLEGWRDNAASFQGLGGYSRVGRTVTGSEGPEILEGTRISHDLFPILGVQPMLGRGFLPEEDSPRAPATLILSHALWQERYGGARDVLGRAVILDGTPHTVVGVMPPGFAFPESARFWVPLQTSASPRVGSLSTALGRLREGVELEGARQDMARVAAIMREAYPGANAEREIAVRPMKEILLHGLKTPVMLFTTVAAAVLLLATANVANLLLVQSSTRGREMIIRTAMGAGRKRILRQLLTESVLLAGGGGLLGSVMGILARDLYISMLPEDLPYYLNFHMDAPVIGLLAVVTLGVGVLFGMGPALEAASVDLFAGLRGGGEGGGSASRPQGHKSLLSSGFGLRRGLLALQLALALAVLVSSGMMAMSQQRLRQVPTGLDPENLLTLQVALSEPFREDQTRMREAFDEIRGRVASLPGVEKAAVISHLPIVGAANGSSLFAEGGEVPLPGQEPWVITKQAQSGYFETMGIPLLEGRGFLEEDGAPGSSPVAVVNESFAQRFWPGEGAVGERVRYGGPDSDFPWMEIVGVVADVRHFGQDRPPEPGLYEPLRQLPYWREYLVVRTAGDPMAQMTGVLAQIRAVDTDAPVFDVLTMEEVLFRSYWQPAVLSRILWILSGLALVLAALGVFGMVSFATARRRREFSIRMALGAERADVVGQALRGAAVPTFVGVGTGILAAWLGVGLAAGLMYGVDRLDPRVALAGALVMVLVAFLAALLPAGRAARLHPVRVLRSD